jgi:hypothetical protein
MLQHKQHLLFAVQWINLTIRNSVSGAKPTMSFQSVYDGRLKRNWGRRAVTR